MIAIYIVGFLISIGISNCNGWILSSMIPGLDLVIAIAFPFSLIYLIISINIAPDDMDIDVSSSMVIAFCLPMIIIKLIYSCKQHQIYNLIMNKRLLSSSFLILLTIFSTFAGTINFSQLKNYYRQHPEYLDKDIRQ